jgi:aconitate hydratase
VLSGNRNFEGRVHPLTRANYLASPPLVVAYALAGRVDIDFETEPIGTGSTGTSIFLRDLFPSRQEIKELEQLHIIPNMFREVYGAIQHGNDTWNALPASDDLLYPWDANSTYIKHPPFFTDLTRELPSIGSVRDAHVLVNVGDSVTTDHISPAGSISQTSPAARFLGDRNIKPVDFNTYGARRGNDDVMCRGTFANIRLINKLAERPGPHTIYLPTGEEMDIYDAAMRYRENSVPVVVLAGKQYGCGSSRDWAAKGPFLLGVKAVIAESYERIHRSNLIGMGILPLQFPEGQSAESLKLSGCEQLSIAIPPLGEDSLRPGQLLTVEVNDGRSFPVLARFDTELELEYFRHGGILQYMIRHILSSAVHSQSH